MYDVIKHVRLCLSECQSEGSTTNCRAYISGKGRRR